MTEHEEPPRPHEEQDSPYDDDVSKAEEKEAGYDAGHQERSPEVDPGPGGYAGRDPGTDMPRMPSVPETQDPETQDE